MRVAEIKRKTKETDISLSLTLDGKGEYEIESGSGFLNHMLELFAKHAKIDLKLTCVGDTEVDLHHTAEDIGICLGSAFKAALGDKRGIVRYGDTVLPMDEALILTAVDISGRGYLVCDLNIRAKKLGDFDVELVDEFWQAFAMNLGCSLHIRQLAGKNSHHIIEGVFKSCARSLRAAVSIDKDFIDDIPSTKGVI
ncbi:MAG: imidazoleglycerol-phosphate dehydratase HisB [Clostridia bacterium]|nr:imidazoleglycerol-phosphate dehydratase HisB [Clostridia bacterium]